MELPPAIAPWAEELGMFRDEVALALGAMVARVAHALGPLPAASRDARDEPDGFSGISRRGAYERLLVAEWLLASEAPEEFIRRAASGEHAFLELERRAPAAERRTLALFDAGPTQLGAPRLAHVAVLVALSRRASEAQATLCWGMLDDDDDGARASLREGVRPEAIGALLGPRRVVEPTAQRLARVRAADDAEASSGRATRAVERDVWVIGGPHASRLAAATGASRVEITDVLDEGQKRLRVVVAGPTSAPRALELALPPDPLVARLFAQPLRAFGVDGAARTLRGGTGGSLVFSASGTKAFARIDAGDFAVSVPEAPGSGARVTKVGPHHVAALGRLGRETFMLTAEPTTRVLQIRRAGARLAAGHFTTTPTVHSPWCPTARGSLSPLVVRSVGATWSAFYRDERRWLFGWPAAGGRATLVERGVLALESNGVHLATVGTEPGPRLSVFPPQPTETLPVPLVVPIGDEPLHDAFIHVRPNGTAVAAVRVGADTWRIADSTDGFVGAASVVDPALVPVGVVPSPFGRGALVTVDPSGRVVFAGQRLTSGVFSIQARAVAVVMDARGRRLAALDPEGHLEIFSLESNACLGRWNLPKDAR